MNVFYSGNNDDNISNDIVTTMTADQYYNTAFVIQERFVSKNVCT